MPKISSISLLAPAKINLFLHVLGRRKNGYHELDSLIAFANFGDAITIEPAGRFEFSVTGTFAHAFTQAELDSTPASNNLVVRATWKLAALTGRTPNVRLTLDKNLPLASGIGGGSADAAACIRGLLAYWTITPEDVPGLDALLLCLGADVPVCFYNRSARIGGIGEDIHPCHTLPAMPVLLVNPGKSCATQTIFKMLDDKFSAPVTMPAPFDTSRAFCDFLAKQTQNDLQAPASTAIPEIGDILTALQSAEHCLLARLSGSGATCFGLFETEEAALFAGQRLASRHPGWWICQGWINRFNHDPDLRHP